METFDQLPLKAELLRAVADLGFSTPSPIQAQALPILTAGKTDFIGLAATGTGKTAAFGLPLLESIDPEAQGVQAIILCPTRELSLQVSEQISLLGKHLRIQTLAIYGGAGYDDQLRKLKRGIPVVVGTPGRIIDHLERGTLKLNNVKVVVLDEADEMVSMGFREAMETILAKVPKESSNTWLFSATMSAAVRKVADEFLTEPKVVQVNRTEMLSATVEQQYYLTHEKNKPEVLCKLIDAADDFYGVVFCQMKALVVDLTRYLSERGYKVDCLHGDMSQAAREAAMLAFRQRRVKILVCTDVASRGLDVKDITHVINYSLPRELDSYVHRIGRTARSGKTGVAMSLVTPSHRHYIQKIERMTKSKMTEKQIPSRKTIAIKKIGQLLEPFSQQKNVTRALELMDESWKQSVAGMSSDEVAARFLALMFPYVFSEQEQPKMVRSQSTSPQTTAAVHTAVTPARSQVNSQVRDERAGRDRDGGRRSSYRNNHSDGDEGSKKSHQRGERPWSRKGDSERGGERPWSAGPARRFTKRDEDGRQESRGDFQRDDFRGGKKKFSKKTDWDDSAKPFKKDSYRAKKSEKTFNPKKKFFTNDAEAFRSKKTKRATQAKNGADHQDQWIDFGHE